MIIDASADVALQPARSIHGRKSWSLSTTADCSNDDRWAYWLTLLTDWCAGRPTQPARYSSEAADLSSSGRLTWGPGFFNLITRNKDSVSKPVPSRWRASHSHQSPSPALGFCKKDHGFYSYTFSVCSLHCASSKLHQKLDPTMRCMR